MTLKQARQIFKEEYAEFIKEKKTDRIAINLEYTYFLDILCKNGEITNKQFSNASNFLRRK